MRRPFTAVILLALLSLCGCATAPTSEPTGATTQPLGPAFVQSGLANPSSGSTISVTLGRALGAGDALYVSVGRTDDTQTVSLSDTRGSAWHQAASVSCSTCPATDGHGHGVGPLSVTAYYALGVSAGTDTITATFSGSVSGPELMVAEYSGVGGFDGASAGEVLSGTPSNSGPVTTTVSGDQLVSSNYVSWQTDGPESGWIERFISSPNSDILEDHVAGAPGSYSGTAPLSAPNGSWSVAAMVAFTPTSTQDAGTDSGPDAGQDTGADTGVDTGTDSGGDSAADSGIDASDTGADTGQDVGSDAPVDIIPVLVQHVSGSSTRNNGFASPFCYHFQLPNPATRGNAIIAGYTWHGSATATVTDDQGDAYMTAATFFDATDSQSIGLAAAFNVAANARVLSLCFSSNPGSNVQPAATELAGVVGLDGQGAGASGSGNAATSGSLTPSTIGDVVYQVAVGPSLSATSWSAGAGPSFAPELLSADTLDAFAAQWGTYQATAPVSPTLYLGTSQHWATATALLKSGAAGSVPSGLRVAHLPHENVPFHTSSGGTGNPFPNPLTVQFPSTGNLLVAMIGGGNATETVTSIVDTNGNTWIQAGSPQVIAGNDTVQAWYASNAATSTNLELQTSWTGTKGDFTLFLYDVAGADPILPFDVWQGATGTQNSAGNLTMPFTLTPAEASEICFAQVIWDFNTAGGLAGSWLFDTNTFSGESQSGPEPVDENNGWGHVVTTSMATLGITWQPLFSGLPVGNWAGNGVCFKAEAE